MNTIRRVTFVTHCHVEDIPQLEEELQEFWLTNQCSLYGFSVASDDPELTPAQWRDAREAILNDEERAAWREGAKNAPA